MYNIDFRKIESFTNRFFHTIHCYEWHDMHDYVFERFIDTLNVLYSMGIIEYETFKNEKKRLVDLRRRFVNNYLSQ